MKIVESNKLVKVKVLFDGNKGWTLTWNKSDFKTIHGAAEVFAKFLQKIQAKDDKTSPNSVRGITYLEITKEISTGSDSTIWVWEKYLKNLK